MQNESDRKQARSILGSRNESLEGFVRNGREHHPICTRPCGAHVSRGEEAKVELPCFQDEVRVQFSVKLRANARLVDPVRKSLPTIMEVALGGSAPKSCHLFQAFLLFWVTQS